MSATVPPGTLLALVNSFGVLEVAAAEQNAASKAIGKAAPEERPARIEAAAALKERLGALDLDVATQFLLVAATLIELKARRLLPGLADAELDEELLRFEERDHQVGDEVGGRHGERGDSPEAGVGRIRPVNVEAPELQLILGRVSPGVVIQLDKEVG